jgi:hypothetical protein
MAARQNNSSTRSNSNPAATYAPYGQFLTPEEPNFMERTLNALGYMNDYQTAARETAEKGGSPVVAGLAAIAKRKNIRDYGKAYAQQEQDKRKELATMGNMIPQDALDQFYEKIGKPHLKGQPLFGAQTYLTPEQIGNMAYNMGSFRQQNMGQLPIYGPMAPATQTGPTIRQNLQQRAKATNFDQSQAQFGNAPFAAGQQAAGVNQPQTINTQAYPVAVGRGQTMQMQSDPSSGGLLGISNQSYGKPKLPMPEEFRRPVTPTGESVQPGAPAYAGNMAQGGGQPPAPMLSTGVQQRTVDPAGLDIDPSLMPTDYPTNVTRMVIGGAQDAQRTFQNQTNRQRVNNQWQVQQHQMQKQDLEMKKLQEETKWLGPKAKAYIANMTRPKGGGSRGSGRAPNKLEVAREMLKNGDITQEQFNEAQRRFIGLTPAKGGGKPKAASPSTLKVLGDLKAGYDDSHGFYGIGADTQKQQYYRDTYNSIADQNNLPRLPGPGGKAAPSSAVPMTAGEWRNRKRGGH